MKYFYIHYKAIGNSIMMCVSLRKHIMNNGYDWEDVEVHCSYPHTDQILQCIPELNKKISKYSREAGLCPMKALNILGSA